MFVYVCGKVSKSTYVDNRGFPPTAQHAINSIET